MLREIVMMPAFGDFLVKHVERTNIKRDIVFHSDSLCAPI
jgi:hypothetical protein